jgi:hypothetical protein
MLYNLLGITAILAIILLVSMNQTGGADEINRIARRYNKCDIKKQVSLKDPKTGIDYVIAFCDSTCENGYPHTINETTMMIPETYPKDRLPTTIEHEKIHLLQRRHPELWEAWYKLLWSYTLQDTPPEGMPARLLSHRRYNPDTANKPFASWKNRYWSVAIYRSGTPGSLEEADTVWWDQQTGAISQDAPPEWQDFFGKSPQDEHPHEMAAQMIANSTGNKNRRQELIAIYEKHFYRTDRG